MYDYIIVVYIQVDYIAVEYIARLEYQNIKSKGVNKMSEKELLKVIGWTDNEIEFMQIVKQSENND